MLISACRLPRGSSGFCQHSDLYIYIDFTDACGAVHCMGVDGSSRLAHLKTDTEDVSRRHVSQLIMRLFLVLLVATTTSAAAATACTVVLGNNRCADALHLLVLLFDLLGIGFRIRVKPGLAILECIHDLLLLV